MVSNSRLKIPRGSHRFPDGSFWVPAARPALLGYRPNAGEWESWGKTTKATLFVGLRTGRKSRGWIKGDRIPDRLLYGLAFGVRTAQVGRQYGASFLKQKGHYIPAGAASVGRESSRREDSMQVIVFPAPAETWARFKKNIIELADAYVEDLAQDSVIVEFMRNGRVEGLGKYKWVPSRKRSR